MNMFRRLGRAAGFGLLRLLCRRHGVSILMASLLLGAVGAARYQEESQPPNKAHPTTIDHGLPAQDCKGLGYTGVAYIPVTNQFFCVPFQG